MWPAGLLRAKHKAKGPPLLCVLKKQAVTHKSLPPAANFVRIEAIPEPWLFSAAIDRLAGRPVLMCSTACFAGRYKTCIEQIYYKEFKVTKNKKVWRKQTG